MADPASVRFFNSGGMYPGPVATRWGSTRSEVIGGGHPIAVFPDPVSGAAAHFDLLRSNYANMPLSDALRRWSGGNNADAYTANVTRRTGLAPDTVITPQFLQGPQGLALAQAMAAHEAGRSYPMTDDQWRAAQARVFGDQPSSTPLSASGVPIVAAAQMMAPPPPRREVSMPPIFSGVAGFKDGGAVASALRIAARQTDTNPTDGQKEAGNYAKGKVRLHGMEIAIENPKGSTRSGKDANGTTWKCTLPAHYGDIKRSLGADGDAVDCYIGDAHNADKVFVVDQIDSRTGKFDEHKVMLSFPSKRDALAAYEKAFSDEKGRERIGSVSEMSVDGFRDWLKSGNTKKPVGDLRKSFADGGPVANPYGEPRFPNLDPRAYFQPPDPNAGSGLGHFVEQALLYAPLGMGSRAGAMRGNDYVMAHRLNRQFPVEPNYLRMDPSVTPGMQSVPPRVTNPGTRTATGQAIGLERDINTTGGRVAALPETAETLAMRQTLQDQARRAGDARFTSQTLEALQAQADRLRLQLYDPAAANSNVPPRAEWRVISGGLPPLPRADGGQVQPYSSRLSELMLNARPYYRQPVEPLSPNDGSFVPSNLPPERQGGPVRVIRDLDGDGYRMLPGTNRGLATRNWLQTGLHDGILPPALPQTTDRSGGLGKGILPGPQASLEFARGGTPMTKRYADGGAPVIHDRNVRPSGHPGSISEDSQQAARRYRADAYDYNRAALAHGAAGAGSLALAWLTRRPPWPRYLAPLGLTSSAGNSVMMLPNVVLGHDPTMEAMRIERGHVRQGFEDRADGGRVGYADGGAPDADLIPGGGLPPLPVSDPMGSMDFTPETARRAFLGPRAPVASSGNTAMGDLLAHYYGNPDLGSNINVGRAVSGAENIAGGVLEGASHLTGIPMAADAGTQMARAVDTGDIMRGMGAAGEMGLAMLPAARPARMALNSNILGRVGVGAGYGGFPLLAAGALSDPAGAQGSPPDDGLTPDMRTRRIALQRKQEKGTPLLRAEREELGQINAVTAEHQRMQSAARIARTTRQETASEGENQRLTAEAVAARDRILNDAPEPFDRAFPNLSAAVPFLPIALGAGTGLALSLPRALGERSALQAWNTAITNAGRTTSPRIRSQMIDEAAAAERNWPVATTRDKLGSYAFPMGLSAVEGAFVPNLPHAYNAIRQPEENPQRQALQEYYRRLPENHPERQRTLDLLNNAAVVPHGNPTLENARLYFSDWQNRALPRSLAGAGEAMGAAIPGVTLGNMFRPYERALPRAQTEALVNARPPTLPPASGGPPPPPSGLPPPLPLAPIAPPPLAPQSVAPSPSAAASTSPASTSAPSHHSHLQPREQGRFAGPPKPVRRPRNPEQEAVDHHSNPDRLTRGQKNGGLVNRALELARKFGGRAKFADGGPPSSDPRFQDPENYVPSEVDYWRREAAQHRRNGAWSLGGVALGLPMMAVGKALAAHPRSGPISRAVGVGEQYIGLGAMGGGAGTAIADFRRSNEAAGRAQEWEQGGRPFTPEHMADSFRPRPPISGPNGQLETVRDPRTGEILNVPQGATWEHDGRQWQLRAPPGRSHGGHVSGGSGPVVAGGIVGDTGGREDAKPVSVKSGSFVIPADCVAALGTGNSLNGMKALELQFGKASPNAMAAGGSAQNVPIRISDGEYVLDPAQVAQVGGGNMERGHAVLDKLVLQIRKNHIATLKQLPRPARD